MRAKALAALGAAAVALAFLATRPPRPAALVLRGGETLALCRAEGVPFSEFLERARAMGVFGLILEPVPLALLEKDGRLLSFARGEVEKWKAVGLIAPGAALKSNTVWIRDRELADAVLAAASSRGAKPSTAAAQGFHILEFTPEADPRELAVADPEQAALARRLGLTAVSPAEAEERGEELPLDDPGEVRRLAYGGVRPLLIARLPAGSGAERALDSLRQAAAELRSAGLLAESAAADGRPLSGVGLAFLIVLAGPLAAARAGLTVLRWARGWTAQVAAASPALELILATGSAAAAGWFLGALSGALGGLPDQGGASQAARAALPLGLGALALWAPDWDGRFPDGARPLTLKAVFRAGTCAAAAVVVLWPSAPEVSGLPWWAAWRWKEVLIGYPALVWGYSLLLKKWTSPCESCEGEGAHPSVEPRPWLLLGLVAPISSIMGGALPRLPFGASLGQALALWAAGLALGGAALAVVERRSKAR